MTSFLIIGILVLLAIILYLIYPRVIKKVAEEQQGLAIDYNTYVFSKEEMVRYSLMLGAIGALLGMIYYGSFIVAVISAFIFTFMLLPGVRKSLINKRKEEFLNQFQEGLYGVHTALSAGRSMEQAFEESLKELNKHTQPLIYQEFSQIHHKLDANIPLEITLEDLANRSHIEDIKNFVDVIITCKRTEGDVIRIIRRTMSIIHEKIQIKRDIEVTIAQKRLEQKILMFMPSGVILFLTLTSRDLLEPMYTTGVGRLLMTLALLANIACYFISAKIVHIEV